MGVLTFWSLILLMLLMKEQGSNLKMAICLLYIGAGIIAGLSYKGSFLAPEPIFTVLGLLSFGIPAVFGIGMAIGNDMVFSTMDNPWTFFIFIIAWIAFVVGCRFCPHRGSWPWNWVFPDNKSRSEKPTLIMGALVFVCIAIGGIMRYHFRLGVAGEAPIIPFAGYLQYLCYGGPMILSFFYLAAATESKASIPLFIGFLSILALAFTQALFKWRGPGLMLVLTATVLVFSMLVNESRAGLKRPLWRVVNTRTGRLAIGIIVISLASGALLSSIGDIQRQTYYTGTYEAMDQGSWLQKRYYRITGFSRLEAVVNHFGLTFTNDFFLAELIRQGRTTVHYVDAVVFGIPEWAQTSVGTSGIGGPYVASGLLGVAVVFFLWGCFWMHLYEYTLSSRSACAYGFYICLLPLLQATLSENFGSGELKFLVAHIVLAGFASRILQMSIPKLFQGKPVPIQNK